MNPILFPHTWMSEYVRSVLFACFKQVTLLQPSRALVPKPLRRLESDGRLDICLPDIKPEDRSGKEAVDDLPNLLSAYNAWAGLHRGERPDFYKFAELHSPNPEDTSTAWIRSKIRNPEGKQTDSHSSPDDREADPLQTARLFLAIAQEYDQQQESLSVDLHTIDDMEQNLLRDLTPDQSSPVDFSAAHRLPADIETGHPMPEQRLSAWRRLYAHLRRKDSISLMAQPLFFATSDEEALRLVLNLMDAQEVVCRIIGIPSVEEGKQFVRTTVHQRIDETLDAAVHGGPLSTDPTILFSENKICPENTGSLTIYRIKGNPMAAAPFGSGSVTKPSETNRIDGERPDMLPCSLVGHIR